MAKAAAKGAAKTAAKTGAKNGAKTAAKSAKPVKASPRADDREAFAARPETTGKVKVAAPQTGAEYLDSLRDGREVYIYGERVKDVTTHPAFRNTARMVARLYDALHDPKRKDKILLPTDTGNGGMTHAFFKAPKTLDETDRRARRHRRMGEAHLRLDGPRARLQGGVPRHARRQRRVLRSVPGRTRGAGTSSARSACPSSTTPSSIRRSTATGRRTRSATSAATWRRRPTPASSCRAPRWWRPARC